VRHAILPVSAMILCRNKYVVADLQPGDQVQGYDYRNKKLILATIHAVNPVAPVQRVQLPLSQFKVIPIAKETIGLTALGTEEAILSARTFLGYCSEKAKLVIREIQCPIEHEETVEAVELQWEWPDYIWFEGILVGTKL
jgi:hypothetical protein